MIDSHCHLAAKEYDADREEVLARAEEHGVEAIVCVADGLDEADACLQLSEEYAPLFATAGVHPHHATDWKEGDAKRLERLLLASQKIVAVGEIGLDYHYDFSPRETQRAVFRQQLELAKKHVLPAVIHCREAIADVRAIIEEVAPPRLVLHCCTEKWEDVSWLIESGHFLSFTGIATYANAEEVRRTIAACPLAQMMIETDGPYLAPVPHRGKRNEPAFVVEVAKAIADIKGLILEEIDRETTRNAVAFFGLAS